MGSNINVILAHNPLHDILYQPCIIMFIRKHAVRQLILEPSAFIIRTFQTPDLIPFFPSAGNFMDTQPVVPVFKRVPTAWTDTVFFTGYRKKSSSRLYFTIYFDIITMVLIKFRNTCLCKKKVLWNFLFLYADVIISVNSVTINQIY